MEYNQAFIVRSNFRDLPKSQLTQHTFIEVVLLDKSPPTAIPILYQLKDKILAKEKASLDRTLLPADSFCYLGEISFWDKKNKKIHLSNGFTICYRHLILCSGITYAAFNTPMKEAFIAGLQTLVEALKVRDKLAESLNPPKKSPVSKKVKAKVAACTALPRNVQPRFMKKEKGGSGQIPSGNRLYEVQV